MTALLNSSAKTVERILATMTPIYIIIIIYSCGEGKRANIQGIKDRKGASVRDRRMVGGREGGFSRCKISRGNTAMTTAAMCYAKRYICAQLYNINTASSRRRERGEAASEEGSNGVKLPGRKTCGVGGGGAGITGYQDAG